MKVSKNSKYQTQKKYRTHEKPKRPNWRARCPKTRAPGALKGALSHFLTSIVAKIKKLKGDPLVKFFFSKKTHNAEKSERGDPLVSPGMVCYAVKQKNLFGSVR